LSSRVVQKVHSADDVVHCKKKRVFYGAVDVGGCRKMQYIVRLAEALRERAAYRRLQVVPLKMNAVLVGLIGRHVADAVERAGDVEAVQKHEIPVSLFEQVIKEVVADKTRRAGNQDALFSAFFVLFLEIPTLSHGHHKTLLYPCAQG